jgi:hypothetical protein
MKVILYWTSVVLIFGLVGYVRMTKSQNWLCSHQQFFYLCGRLRAHKIEGEEHMF